MTEIREAFLRYAHNYLDDSRDREVARHAFQAGAEVERLRITIALRKAGATVPARDPAGTPESGVLTGLSLALCVAENP